MQQNRVGEQKSLRLFGRFSIIFALLCATLFGQSFEDFKHNEISSFQKFRDERDQAFQLYLKSQWKAYQAEFSQALYKEKKPRTMQQTQSKKIPSVGPTIRIEIKKHKKLPKKENIIVQKKKNDITIDYFGESLGFNIDKKYKKARYYPQTQEGIVNFFNVLASSDYEANIIQLQNIQKRLELNDWAMYLLIDKLAQNIYHYEDEKKLFTWFMFNKLSYAVKIALSGKHILLMFQSNKIIYSTPNYTFKKKKFYVISEYAKDFSKNVYTYAQNYPDANKALDLSLKKLPNFKQDMKSKILTFKKFGTTYNINYLYNKNLIDFMATYPQADYETYFNAPLSDVAYKEIKQSVQKYIDGKKMSVGINFILNFVQNAFYYEVDQTQFGREKVMFADETLYYAKSDCEDRAILFARLVKSLFGITVTGVKYKDHMATALYIPLKGDTVKVGSRRFVIADPTYINANIGESMPKYKKIIPESFITLQGE